MSSNPELRESTITEGLLTGESTVSTHERISQTCNTNCDEDSPPSKCDFLRDSGVKSPMLEINDGSEDAEDSEDEDQEIIEKHSSKCFKKENFVKLLKIISCR